MDKNKIHIDEFVRQMMTDREEEKPSGAWLGMRQLLDEAMPVAGSVAGNAFNWRRFLGIASAVVVATGLSIGGYQLASAPQAAENAVIAAATAPADGQAGFATEPVHRAGNSSHDSRSATPSNDLASANGGAASAAPTTSAKGPQLPTGVNSAAASVDNSTAAASSGGVAPESAENKASPATGRQSGQDRSGGAQAAKRRQQAAAQRHQSTVLQSAAVSGENSRIVSNTAQSELMAATAPTGQHARRRQSAPNGSGKGTPTNTQRSAPNRGANTGGTTENNAGQNNSSMAGSIARTGTQRGARAARGARNQSSAQPQRAAEMALGTSAANSNAGRRSASTRPFTKKQKPDDGRPVVMDSVTENVLELRQYRDPAARAWKLDTIGSYQRQRPVPRNEEAPAEETAPEPKAAPRRRSYGPNPDASAYEPQAGSAVANLLASGKPAAKKATGASDMYEKEAALSLAAAIDRTKSAFSQIQFLPGILGGFNATLGSTNFLGFQLGLSGMFLVNEKWSFGVELKYMQRANRGASIQDNYLSTVTLSPGVHKEDTVNHFFNFSSLQSLEMPVVLRREIGRFFAIAGANLMYAFTVHPDEMDQPQGTGKVWYGSLPPNSNLGLQRTPGIATTDFNQRFGLGYIIGAGYAVTPALQIDVRMTQIAWDNAKSSGAQRVSKELYRAPSVQFTIGYRFNTK